MSALHTSKWLLYCDQVVGALWLDIRYIATGAFRQRFIPNFPVVYAEPHWSINRPSGRIPSVYNHNDVGCSADYCGAGRLQTHKSERPATSDREGSWQLFNGPRWRCYPASSNCCAGRKISRVTITLRLEPVTTATGTDKQIVGACCVTVSDGVTPLDSVSGALTAAEVLTFVFDWVFVYLMCYSPNS